MNRIVWIFLAATATAYLFVLNDGFAQSSIGIGRSEQIAPMGGLFSGFFEWVRIQQAEFHQAIRKILVAMRKEDGAVWPLVSICFLYGVFHAIGPGHGKVVVSSYMLANEVAMKRGVIVSMAASIMQGLTAIAAITIFLFALRGTGIRSGELAYGLELASYIGVMAIGAWLLWKKLFRRKSAHTHDYSHDHGHNHDHDHSHDHHHHDHGHDHAHSGDGDVCDHCGHSHAPDPSALTGQFGVKEAWAAVLAVGLRPCTGALIVLVFCFANGLYFAGIASTFAMSIGTGMAVSTLAILAVTAKNLALRISGAQDRLGLVNSVIEITGAVLILLIGFVLFTAAWSS
jgi:ABC-type nickel/cobalt efflux system permease component RcnA